jgi:hypothetical protein
MPHILHPSEVNQKLIEIASRDGIISEDEQAILENVRKNITKYFKVLYESYDDDIITADELHP